MDQEKRFQICYNKEVDEYFIKDYPSLIQELEKKYKGKCLLFDQTSEILITPQNLGFYSLLTLCVVNEIPTILQKLQNYEDKLKQLTDDSQIQQEITEKKNTIVGKTILEWQVEEGEIKEKVKKLEKENKKLQSEVNQLKVKEQKIQQLSAQSSHFSNQIANLKSDKIHLKDEIDKLSIENSQLIQLKSKSEKIEEFLQNSDLELRVLKRQNEELRQQLDYAFQELQKSKEEKRYFQLESDKFQKELKQSKELIDHLTIESKNLSIQLLESKKYANYSHKSSDQQNIESQKKYLTVCCVHNLYTDEEQQEDKKMQGDQIKFLHNIIIKQLDEIKRTRDINSKTDRSTTFLQTNEFEVYSITLKEQQFQKCINEKNFFFRQNCINKQRCYYAQSINEQKMAIIVNGQLINIQKLLTLSKSDHEAIDTILNILIVQGYFTLFQRDLQKNSNQQFQQIWNLRIPKQFLVKDQMDNYYVYQECLQTNIKTFIPFQTTSPMDQYISSFFRYFYFATNKNLALTECQFGESNDNNEIIILSIIIHSNYKNGLSCFDLGKTKIEELEEMLKAPGGRTQKYWSDELQNLAKKVWNDPQQF